MALKFKIPFGSGSTPKIRATRRGQPLIKQRDEERRKKRRKQLRTPGQKTRRV